MLFKLHIFALISATLLIVGCNDSSQEVTRVVELTNQVEIVREVIVTNVVNVVVTNVIAREESKRVLSARKTSPYVVTSTDFDVRGMRKLLSENAVRIIECNRGAIALVEASDKTIAGITPIANVRELRATDKIAADVGERIRVIPLSSIDSAAVANAIRSLGGELVQVITVGKPVIRAKMSYNGIHKLAERGDVRSIERDEK